MPVERKTSCYYCEGCAGQDGQKVYPFCNPNTGRNCYEAGERHVKNMAIAVNADDPVLTESQQDQLFHLHGGLAQKSRKKGLRHSKCAGLILKIPW